MKLSVKMLIFCLLCSIGVFAQKGKKPVPTIVKVTDSVVVSMKAGAVILVDQNRQPIEKGYAFSGKKKFTIPNCDDWMIVKAVLEKNNRCNTYKNDCEMKTIRSKMGSLGPSIEWEKAQLGDITFDGDALIGKTIQQTKLSDKVIKVPIKVQKQK